MEGQWPGPGKMPTEPFAQEIEDDGFGWVYGCACVCACVCVCVCGVGEGGGETAATDAEMVQAPLSVGNSSIAAATELQQMRRSSKRSSACATLSNLHEHEALSYMSAI